jgi:nucleoside-diphosphate-sugar epimerase
VTSDPTGPRVLLTGASRPLGRRLLSLLAGDPDVHEVVAVDALDLTPVRALWTPGGPSLRTVRGRLASLDLEEVVAGVDQVIHLAAGTGDELDGTGVSGVDVPGTRALLAALGPVRSMVVLSSATVYGAWPRNPVPLTERAPVRPNPGLEFADQKAEVERLVLDWAADAPSDPKVAILRPTLTLSAESLEWMERSAWGVVGLRAGSDVPPAQFLHLDDLASAVDLARARSLDGPFNVAPDGWIPPDDLVGLRGAGPRVPLPVPMASRLAALTHRMSLLSTPSGAVPYTMHPWVVANDRLRAAGWTPRWTNEEAFVAGTRAGPWATLNARRRQELGLAAAVVALVALVVAVVVAVRRWAR